MTSRTEQLEVLVNMLRAVEPTALLARQSVVVMPSRNNTIEFKVSGAAAHAAYIAMCGQQFRPEVHLKRPPCRG